MTHKDIQFNSRQTKVMKTKENQEQDNGEIGKNQTRQIQKIYLSIFDPTHICSTKRSLKSYQKDMNRTMK